MSTTPIAVDRDQLIKTTLAKIGDIATLPEVTCRIIAAVDDPRSTAYSVVYDYLWADSAGKERAKAALNTLDGDAFSDVLNQSLEFAPDLYEPASELVRYLIAADRTVHSTRSRLSFARTITRSPRACPRSSCT